MTRSKAGVVPVTMTLGQDMHDNMTAIMREDGINRSALLRKALALYISARDGARRGYALRLVDPVTNRPLKELRGICPVDAVPGAQDRDLVEAEQK